MRAGSQTLTLLATPRTFLILQSLAEGTKGQFELRRDSGLPAQSTLRGHLKTLEAAKAVAKRRRDSFPSALEYELTERGRELLAVGSGMERWLAEAPGGSFELGSDPARAAIKGLADGWLARIMEPLSDASHSLTELDKVLSDISYPTIERRLETMKLAGQLDAEPRSSGGARYAINTWLRRGIVPLAIAARWEERHRPEGASPITRLEVESAFKITAPLLEFASSTSAICQIAVTPSDQREEHRRFLGLMQIQNGKVSLGEVYAQHKPDTWVSGQMEAWFSAVIDGNSDGLRRRGDRGLIQALFDRVHETLFASEALERRPSVPSG